MSTSTTGKNKKNRKRAAAIALCGLGVVGLGAASAATLNIHPTGYADVAAGSAAVTIQAACDTDVDIAFTPDTTADPVSGALPVKATVSDIDAACAGQNMTVQVYNGTTKVGAGNTVAVAGTSAALNPLTGVTTATAFNKVAIVIAPAG